MNSVKILHTADLHLGSFRTGVKHGKSEIENTFLRIINLCKSERIDFLLIAGDLFDTPFVPAEDASRIISAIRQIPDTIVAISPGNHDCACPGSVYLKCSFPENTVIFNSFMEYRDFPEKGVRLWGAGFTDRFENFALLKANNDCAPDLVNLCVLHGEVVSEGSSSTYNPVTLSAIEKSGFDYLALGHIHKRTEIKKFGNTFYSYSGCPDGMGFDEPGAQGVYIGEVSKTDCRLEFRELSSRKYIIDSVNIDGCENSIEAADKVLEHITRTYGEDCNDNLYRISLCGTLRPDTSLRASQVQTALLNTLSYAEVFDKTDSDINYANALAEESSLRGIFAKKMLSRLSSAPPELQATYQEALKIGLRAFNKGVKLNDN